MTTTRMALAFGLRNHGYVDDGSYERKFVARHLYGDYLCQLIAPLSQRGKLTQRLGQVDAIVRTGDGFSLTTATGEMLFADAVVLCCGNQPPSRISQVMPSTRYINDVWRPDPQ